MDIYKSKVILALLIFSSILSCKSTPEAAPPPEKEEQVQAEAQISAAAEEPEEEIITEPAPFDPSKITVEQHSQTREEVRRFIDNVNLLIRNRNFRQWEAVLSPHYIEITASAENLQRISETVIMRNNRIVLRTLEDYFLHVVVPSRASVNTQENIDIEFLSENRVQAFSIRVTNTGVEQHVMLYELEKIDNSWTILN